MLQCRLLASISLVSIVACETSPEMPAIVVTPNYVENVTYNTTVNVVPEVVATALPPVAPPPAPAPPPPPPPRTPSLAPTSPAVLSSPPDPRLSTGVPVCDEYIARVKKCTPRMFGPTAPDEALRNIDDSMELMRRNFRRTLRTHPDQRATFVDTCTTSLAMYNRSVQQSARGCE